MTLYESEVRTLAESTSKVMRAIAEERLQVMAQPAEKAGDRLRAISYYVIPEYLMENGSLKAGVVTQLRFDGALDYLDGEEVVGTAYPIQIPLEDETFVLSFVRDLL